MGKPKHKTESSRKPVLSESPLDKLDLNEMLDRVIAATEGTGPAQHEEKEVESWLDWGLGLVEKLGPMALEMAPALLALL